MLFIVTTFSNVLRLCISTLKVDIAFKFNIALQYFITSKYILISPTLYPHIRLFLTVVPNLKYAYSQGYASVSLRFIYITILNKNVRKFHSLEGTSFIFPAFGLLWQKKVENCCSKRFLKRFNCHIIFLV